MRAVIYARFSCSKQREASIEDQLRVCREWCEREGHEVVAEYCDRAASGRSDARPQFQRMVENAGESDLVVVYMMDRFSRDVYDAPIYKKRLRDRGVRVVSATESVPDGPESILVESIYEAMAAMESAHIAQRTRRGMQGNALKCHHNGVRVFGYDFGDDGHYVVNPAEAAVVREVFNRRSAGEAPNAIAADLARRGWKTTQGRPCSHSMVDTMLHNEKYRGVYSWGEVRVEGGMPAIVTREEFDMANGARTKKERKGEEWGDYALAGRGVCMECGMNLVGVSGYGHAGKRYDYYRCSKRCGNKPIRADWLEAAIVGVLREMLSDEASVDGIARIVAAAVGEGDASRRLERADATLAEARRGIANIMRAVEDGMPYADVADRLAELKAQRDRAEADRELWSRKSELDVDDFRAFLRGAATLSDADLLRAFVWQVAVGAERVDVALNYDVKEDEPARIEFLREFVQKKSGSPDLKMCELGNGRQVMVLRRMVLVSFPRAA